MDWRWRSSVLKREVERVWAWEVAWGWAREVSWAWARGWGGLGLEEDGGGGLVGRFGGGGSIVVVLWICGDGVGWNWNGM